MFLELIATFIAGIAAAGVIILLNRLTGRRLPRWFTPVGAGLAMFAATIASEYGWFDRTVATLPEGVKVASTVEEQSWLRPWTQVWPYTKRFVAVDVGTARTNDAFPDQRLADLYFFGRWSPLSKAPFLIDCAAARSAILIDGATFGADGEVTDAEWAAMPPDDPILKLACET